MQVHGNDSTSPLVDEPTGGDAVPDSNITAQLVHISDELDIVAILLDGMGAASSALADNTGAFTDAMAQASYFALDGLAERVKHISAEALSLSR